MTGSPSAKSSEDRSSSNDGDKKHQEKSKRDSSLPTASKIDSKKADLKETSSISKDIAAVGNDGLLDVIDEDNEELLGSYASIKIDEEEKAATKSSEKSPTDNSEETTLCLHTDDSDHVKIDETISSGNNQTEKKALKDAVKQPTTKTASNKSKPADKTVIKNKMIWVYNILPSTKASELKIHFSKFAKITTARVVTDGRKYYGCLTVEDEASVKECIKQLNKTIIDGQEIKVQPNAPDHDSDSNEEKQAHSNNNDNAALEVEKRATTERKPRSLNQKIDRKTDKPDPLTRVIKSPKRNRSPIKELPQEKARNKRRRSRSNSIELETRKKVIELRRLTADIDELQRRKDRLILEEKEKERERRENERIQEMRRKMEEERAHKRMEIDLAKKKLEFERILLEKERDAFMKLKTIEIEELRIRSEAKRKIEEAEDYERKITSKMSKERGDRKRSSSPSKRFQQNYNESSKQRNRGDNRSRSPNLYLNSQKFDIKPLKREATVKYPPAPKISSPTIYNQRGNNKSSSEHSTYYNQKENRYNNNSKYSGSGNKSPTNNKAGKSDQQHLSTFAQTKSTTNNSTWLPSTLSTSSNYRQQQQQMMNDHHSGHHGGNNQATLNIPWQQISSNNSKLGGGRYEPQQQQLQQQYHHSGMHHQVQYPSQIIDNGVGGGSSKRGGGRNQGGYQSGRRY